MKILFVIDTFHRGRHVLLEIPFLNSRKETGTSTSNWYAKEKDYNGVIAEIFSHKNKLSTNYIFDIIIDSSRYISYPVWLDQNKYLNNKISKMDLNEEGNNSEEEALSNVVKLKMFNLVIETDKRNLILQKGNLNIIYGVLESFSQFLSFEEYRNEFLGKEILNIFKALANQDSEYMEDLPGQISAQVAKIFSNLAFFSGSGMKNEKEKEHREKGLILIKSLVKFYEDLKTFRFFKIPINNRYDFKAPAKLINFSNDVENFHTLVVMKRKALDEWLSHNYDLNPLIQLFLNLTTPFKSFQDLSIEYKIPLDFIKLLAKQIHCLNLGRIMKKFNNCTVLTVNPEMKIKKDIENEYFRNYNLNLYESLNCFMNGKRCLNKVFKKSFNQITGEKFINLVQYLISNECLVQCNIHILPKVPFKKMYNPERILLANSQIFFTKYEKLDAILNDLDADDGKDYQKGKSDFEGATTTFKSEIIKPLNIGGNEIYFEDIISKMKMNDGEAYEVLRNIFYLCGPDYDFDDICYLTGFRDDIINKVIKKYRFLFDIIVSVEVQGFS